MLGKGTTHGLPEIAHCDNSTDVLFINPLTTKGIREPSRGKDRGPTDRISSCIIFRMELIKGTINTGLSVVTKHAKFVQHYV